MVKKELFDLLEDVLRNPGCALFFTPPHCPGATTVHFPKPFASLKFSTDLSRNFHHIDKLIDRGLAGYAIINYEAGFLLEPRLFHLFDAEKLKDNVFKFVFFKQDDVKIYNSTNLSYRSLEKHLKDKTSSVKNISLNETKRSYLTKIKKIRKELWAGNTYQTNFTAQATFNVQDSISDFINSLLFNQSSQYTAIINSGEKLILSFSPELFFSIDAETITTKPMKGTIRRGKDHTEDQMLLDELKENEKTRAENVMIVDLLRNDLTQICKPGTIKVKSLFKVSRYESLFQMTSTIQGKLKSLSLFEILKGIFPCGSVTGAPKIKTMEIIHQLEKTSRGIYTGSIGLILPGKKVFNVAIRTAVIDNKSNKGTIGLGGGIVWDSSPAEEYNELLLKGRFLTHPKPYFEIFTSMRFENGEIFLIEDHLKRLNTTADYFGFIYKEKEIITSLVAHLLTLDVSLVYKVKLSLSKWGSVTIESMPVNVPESRIKIFMSDHKIDSKEVFQYYKTSNRKLYEKTFKEMHNTRFFDALFINERDELCEGCITNVFIRKGNKWFTPPLSSGILEGIYRNHLIGRHKNISEQILFTDDLLHADEVILTNAVRKETIVHEIHDKNGLIKRFF